MDWIISCVLERVCLFVCVVFVCLCVCVCVCVCVFCLGGSVSGLCRGVSVYVFECVCMLR